MNERQEGFGYFVMMRDDASSQAITIFTRKA